MSTPSPAHRRSLGPGPSAWPRPLDLPMIGHTYPQLLRTPRHRWWNPLASTGFVIGGVLAATLVVAVPMTITMVGLLGPDAYAADAVDAESLGTSIEELSQVLYTAPMMFWNNLLLASFIPIAVLAVAVCHPVAARFVHSVQGRVRWGWLARAHLVLLPLFLVYVAGAWWADGAVLGQRSEDWGWHVLMALTLTPLQAAGEEYLFRGWLVLALCSWFRRPLLGLALAALVSAATFSLAHLSLDPWIVLDLSVFAVAAVVLVWRTGGLEAAVALHVVNNVVVIIAGALTGGLQDSFVDAETTQAPATALLSAAVVALATALLLWQARRAGVARTVPVSVGARP